MPKRVAVVGSREYRNLGLVREFVRRLADWDPGATVVSGNARGVDRAAEAEAREVGLEVVSLPADWHAYGWRAGFVRNGEIVRRCDAVAGMAPAAARWTRSRRPSPPASRRRSGVPTAP